MSDGYRPDNHPRFDADPGEEQWVEMGWICAKLYFSPREEDDGLVMMKWCSDGLDWYQQVGIIATIGLQQMSSASGTEDD